MPATDLFDLAAELLAAADEALADAPGGQIADPFVSPGLPAFDFTPFLSVHVGGPQQADTAPLQPPLQPGHRARDTGAVNLIPMTITVTRNVPMVVEQGGLLVLPSTADMQASAELSCGDIWAIWNHLRTKYRNDDLFASPGSKREFFFDGAVSVHAQGGHGGFEIPVRVQLDGYETSLP